MKDPEFWSFLGKYSKYLILLILLAIILVVVAVATNYNGETVMIVTEIEALVIVVAFVYMLFTCRTDDSKK